MGVIRAIHAMTATHKEEHNNDTGLIGRIFRELGYERKGNTPNFVVYVVNKKENHNEIGLRSITIPAGKQCAAFLKVHTFLIADVDNSTVTAKRSFLTTRSTEAGSLAVDDTQIRVTHVISGGMGMVQQKFRENGIIVFGHAGKAKEAIEDLLKNGLGGLEACSHGHQHKEGE